jgi:hypothetical protein
LAETRRAARTKNTPTAAPAPITSVRMLVVTQVRQALQHAVAIGACSLYFPAT